MGTSIDERTNGYTIDLVNGDIIAPNGWNEVSVSTDEEKIDNYLQGKITLIKANKLIDDLNNDNIPIFNVSKITKEIRNLLENKYSYVKIKG